MASSSKDGSGSTKVESGEPVLTPEQALENALAAGAAPASPAKAATRGVKARAATRTTTKTATKTAAAKAGGTQKKTAAAGKVAAAKKAAKKAVEKTAEEAATASSGGVVMQLQSAADIVAKNPPKPAETEVSVRQSKPRKPRTIQNPVKLRADVNVRDLDLTLPSSQRPILGSEVEAWRNSLRLSRYQAQMALGLNTIAAYVKMVESNSVIPFTTELLFRLYDLSPRAPGWGRYSFRELFDELYRDDLMHFRSDPERARSASVLLSERFTMLFHRSKTRAYQWFADGPEDTGVTAYADIAMVLCKLKSMEGEIAGLDEPYASLGTPAKVFEQVSIECWRLRGHDFAKHFPIPKPGELQTQRPRGAFRNAHANSSGSLWAMLKTPLDGVEEVDEVEPLLPASMGVGA